MKAGGNVGGAITIVNHCTGPTAKDTYIDWPTNLHILHRKLREALSHTCLEGYESLSAATAMHQAT
jgi:hypothetical protein